MTELRRRISLVGVVHLPPLPGAPRARLSMQEIVERAVNDARTYQAGGASAVIVENFGDVPFHKDSVAAYTVAAMTVVVTAVRSAIDLPVGVNVLRNDAIAALSIAAVTGAAFIRVNVHTGALLTDQGIIEGRAAETLRLRTLLGAKVDIWSDVLVKHGWPLSPVTLAEAARETVERGLADALIVTGTRTGEPPSPEDVQQLRVLFPTVPIYVGSGVTPGRIAAFSPAATGFIVGTWAKSGGVIDQPVDVSRVQALASAISVTWEHEQDGNRAPRV